MLARPTHYANSVLDILAVLRTLLTQKSALVTSGSSSEQSLTCDSTSLRAGGSVRRGMNPEPTAIVAQLLRQRISNTKEVHSILSWMDTLTGRVGTAIMNTNTQRLTLTHNQTLSPHYSTCHSHAEPRPQ